MNLETTGWGNRVLIGGEAEGYAAQLQGVFRTSPVMVHRAPTGRKAIEWAAVLQPDVIVLDASLPDMSGLDACRSLLTGFRASLTTPVLLATAATPTSEERLAAIRAGARGFVGPWILDEDVRSLIGAHALAKREADRGMAECLIDPGTGLYNRRGLLRRAHEVGAHATRGREALTCLVMTIDLGISGDDAADLALFRRCSREVRSAGRLSDVIGRPEANQLAAFAPSTDAGGAVGMARRLGKIIRSKIKEERANTVPVLRAGYDSVANLGYTPLGPTTMLLRASTAISSGKPEPSDNWIRRFESATGLH